MAPALPIKFQELVQLSSLGVNQTAITFNTCVCVPRPPARSIHPVPTLADLDLVTDSRIRFLHLHP